MGIAIANRKNRCDFGALGCIAATNAVYILEDVAKYQHASYSNRTFFKLRRVQEDQLSKDT